MVIIRIVIVVVIILVIVVIVMVSSSTCQVHPTWQPSIAHFAASTVIS